ncbi:MAG: hypothetical protein SGJ00_00970 [bacterium]|nr:hypothetical protein [bacterium]
MDDLNKRVLSVMEKKLLSKSAFANILDISLPVLTHIGSGRNKPGIDLITKILTNFPEISPDWLLLGIGTMKREQINKPDISLELQKLTDLSSKFPDFNQNASKILEYHAILLKEILYLNELNPYLKAIQNNSDYFSLELAQLKDDLIIKVKD